MIKLRVEGLPAEVEEFIAGIGSCCEVLSQSQMYTNRGESRYVRVYLDVLSCKKPDKVAAKLIKECILQESCTYCSTCDFCDEEEQGRLCDEDDTLDPCMKRRLRGTDACIEGIYKYFEKNKNLTSDLGAEKK